MKEKQIERIKNALALLNSMVINKEEHNTRSKKVFNDAWGVIKEIENNCNL